jgi:hypothetical protein
VGVGAAAATIRFELSPGAPAIDSEMARRLMDRIFNRSAVAAVTLGMAQETGAHPLSSGAAAESWGGGPRYVLVAEATARATLVGSLPEIVTTLVREVGATNLVSDIYDLAVIVRHPGSGPRPRKA